MFYSVDEIEESLATLIGDDKSRLVLPLSALPPGIGQGDILRFCNGAAVLCKDERRRRQRRLAEQMARLNQKTDKK